jgi:hypothetical protein
MIFSASNKDTILYGIRFGGVRNRQDAKSAKKERREFDFITAIGGI